MTIARDDLDRLAHAAAQVAHDGTAPRAVQIPLRAGVVERLEPAEWQRVVNAYRDRMERRLATLETQVHEQTATLTLLARMLRGEGGALPYTRQDALALVESALRVTEDEAREALTAELARYTADEPF